ncbi:puratrophin-1-like isoform X2 [Dunckerocampus dactyliophorus]|uniref:puratrophin-1-like isoform X2 n=1 Tax=Dunckerocampus dactyliophorus TaxID=161453 RepID=UPI002406893F|nr:puratrophin-1-like isoform X2 [Dunckerocampus dactyliophorus]
MNPESLDSSIQSALSALYPPFEATAPIVLCQLFRTIEERYHGDALQCLLDFLIPSKHLLESVQQAACAGYSDVVFRCEGWPLCLHDKTVVQLAPVNPLLLRPGDFYFQVEPFGDQAARIVLKSLLEEGCREVEETPIPETSYPCIFTEDWLQDINEGRHGTPLSRCLLCTDQGVIKLPWEEVAIPEFLDKPKVMTTYREAPTEPKVMSVPCSYGASTLPLEERIIPLKGRMSASLRPVDCSSKVVRLHHKRMPKSFPKPLVKPVGWVSPNTWDSRNYPESEGDYVDLVDVAKEKQFVAKHGNHPNLPNSVLIKPVRAPPSALLGSSLFCGHTLQYAEEPCTPCSQRNLGDDPSEHDVKCRYRDSYLAALSNPVTFEKGNVDLLAALEEDSLCEDLDLRSEATFEDQNNVLGQFSNHCKTPMSGQYRHFCEPATEFIGSHHKNLPTTSEAEDMVKDSPIILKSSPGLNNCHKVHTEHISQETQLPELPLDNCDHQDNEPHQKVDVVKPPGKHKSRSLSAVSDTPQGSPLFYKHKNRSHSDICSETVNSMMQCNKGELLDLVTPKTKSSIKDSQSSGSETPSTSDGPYVRPQNLKTQDMSSSQLLSVSSNSTPQSLGSSVQSVSGLLELGIICLPGSRDKTGRAVVELYCDKEWTSTQLSAQNLCRLLLYLHSIPRKDVRELGLTLVIDARKKTPPPDLYKALLMAQEQALHAVHSILMLVDKDTSPRPEKQPGLQMDLVTSMKALYKTVEACQLTPYLGGTFTYSHTDWLQFHQRLMSFITDLQEADSLLQRAISKVNESNILDTAQEVRRCIQEQGDLMREVLKDTGLVTLQREGGAVLARLRREEFRFPQSEDYRYALESVTLLYNQVEEKLHMLVMRSNESLQQLEFLFVVREMEEKIKEAAMWFNEEGEHGLKVFVKKDNLDTENILPQFDTFFIQAKDKQQYALTLVTEAEKIVSTGVCSPVTDVFRTLIDSFKCNMDDFMSRVVQTHKELDTLVQVYRFCDEASALAKECSQFLEQVEQGCYLAQASLSTLQMYEERLGDEFSTLHFQALKSKACSLRSGASGAMSVWNAAWVRCQEVRQRLEKMQKKKKTCRDKKQNQQTAAMCTHGEAGVMEKKTLTQQPTSQKDVVDITETDNAAAVWFKNNLKVSLKGNEKRGPHALKLLPLRNEDSHISPHNGKCQLDNKWGKRGHQSEMDLRSTVSVQGDDDIPMCQSLGRSLSEGSCVRTHMPFAVGFSPLNGRQPLCQSNKQALELHLETLQHLPTPLTESMSKSNGNNEECPTKEHAASTQSPEDLKETLLISTEHNGSNVLKLRKIMEELLSTEREYVKALGYVREHYFPELERCDVPQDLRGQKGSIFGNLEKLHDFHHHHFLSELENCLNEPFRVGRCFLRHRENFALYALYSKNKPQSDSLLINHGKAFFKQKQLNLRDKMDLWSYLLKPVQRISKYSLLLQDMMRECSPVQVRELAELKAALEVVHFQLRHGNNLLAMDAVHQCDVNLKEQGQLIRQDEFSVTFRKKKCSRHIFLFQELILFSKTRKTDVGNDTYIYKQSFKTSDVGMTQNTGDTGLCFEIWFRKRKTEDTYTLQAVSREVKEAWTKDLERILWDQALHNREVRMQERVFMGIGNKPFKDIQPSDAAISDRAVDCGLIGRENKVLSYVERYGQHNGLPGARPKSAGSGSISSSSSSSGRGSLSPTTYLCVPKRRGLANSFEGYVSPPGVLAEDDVDHESASHNLLLDSSESSGESVSGLSSSAHSYRSVHEKESEEMSSVCTTMNVREAGGAHRTGLCASPAKKQPTVAAQVKPHNKAEDLLCGNNVNVAKSTEV